MAKKKPSKKPTAGQRIAANVYDECESGCPCPSCAATRSDLARSIDRAIAAAVRKERERCIKIIETTPFDHDVIAKIRSGT